MDGCASENIEKKMRARLTSFIQQANRRIKSGYNIYKIYLQRSTRTVVTDLHGFFQKIAKSIPFYTKYQEAQSTPNYNKKQRIHNTQPSGGKPAIPQFRPIDSTTDNKFGSQETNYSDRFYNMRYYLKPMKKDTFKLPLEGAISTKGLPSMRKNRKIKCKLKTTIKRYGGDTCSHLGKDRRKDPGQKAGG